MIGEEPVFIILPWPSVGGMEKRLAGLFLHLAARGDDVRLVCPMGLVSALVQTAEARELAGHAARIHAFDAGSDPFGRLRAHLREVMAGAPGGIFHYGLASPLRLHASRTPRTLYTIPNATLAQYNARGLAEVYGGVLRASRVDVLDPQVFRALAARFPWRRGSFSLTPGSFVDLDVYRAERAVGKEPLIAFCGLLSEEKSAPRLASCAAELLERLDGAGVAGASIALMGRDPDGGTVTAAVRALGTPRVRVWHEPNPATVLGRAKVFLSLQRTTNHPSKSLLEAMACGAAPVVTDTRDSRLSAPDRLASYVPLDFSARDLADACAPLLRRTDAEIDAHTEAMRAFLGSRFSLATMAAYYTFLYDQLRALPVAAVSRG